MQCYKRLRERCAPQTFRCARCLCRGNHSLVGCGIVSYSEEKQYRLLLQLHFRLLLGWGWGLGWFRAFVGARCRVGWGLGWFRAFFGARCRVGWGFQARACLIIHLVITIRLFAKNLTMAGLAVPSSPCLLCWVLLNTILHVYTSALLTFGVVGLLVTIVTTYVRCLLRRTTNLHTHTKFMIHIHKLCMCRMYILNIYVVVCCAVHLGRICPAVTITLTYQIRIPFDFL